MVIISREKPGKSFKSCRKPTKSTSSSSGNSEDFENLHLLSDAIHLFSITEIDCKEKEGTKISSTINNNNSLIELTATALAYLPSKKDKKETLKDVFENINSIIIDCSEKLRRLEKFR
jgi:hypothetical protein